MKNMPEPSEVDAILFKVRLSPESNSAATLQHRESRLHTCFLDQTCSMSKLFIGIDVLSHPRKSFHVVDPTLAERGAKG